MMFGGAIVNALAFSGSNFIFSRLERSRHNKAMEDLQRKRDEWNQERIARIDFINQRLKEEGHAEKTFRSVDEAMQNYYYLTGDNLEAFPPEPQLSDVLNENDNEIIKNTELTLLGAGLLITGYLTYKFI